MKTEIQEKLEQLAYNRTTPFCYGCYVKAPKGVCPHCHSDDLMRHLKALESNGEPLGSSNTFSKKNSQQLILKKLLKSPFASAIPKK